MILSFLWLPISLPEAKSHPKIKIKVQHARLGVKHLLCQFNFWLYFAHAKNVHGLQQFGIINNTWVIWYMILSRYDFNLKFGISREKGSFYAHSLGTNRFFKSTFYRFLFNTNAWASHYNHLFAYLILFVPKNPTAAPNSSVILLEHWRFRTISGYVLRLSQGALWWRSWALVRLIQEKVSHVFILFREAYCTVLNSERTRPLPLISDILNS